MVVHLHCTGDVRHEDTGAINGHSSYPEANVLTVRLLGLCLRQNEHSGEIDNERMPHSVDDPLSKDELGEALSIQANRVETRIPHEVFGTLWPVWVLFLGLEVLVVESGEPTDGKRSHCDVVQLVDEWVVESLAREGTQESKDKLHYNVKHVLVEVIGD